MRVIESDARINWIVAEEGRQHSPQLANPNAASARRPEAPRGAAPSFTGVAQAWRVRLWPPRFPRRPA